MILCFAGIFEVFPAKHLVFFRSRYKITITFLTILLRLLMPAKAYGSLCRLRYPNVLVISERRLKQAKNYPSTCYKRFPQAFLKELQ